MLICADRIITIEERRFEVVVLAEPNGRVSRSATTASARTTCSSRRSWRVPG
ncbi:MAG: hypothetical protein ACR2KW_10415 [Rubrobacter sp.]